MPLLPPCVGTDEDNEPSLRSIRMKTNNVDSLRKYKCHLCSFSTSILKEYSEHGLLHHQESLHLPSLPPSISTGEKNEPSLRSIRIKK